MHTVQLNHLHSTPIPVDSLSDNSQVVQGVDCRGSAAPFDEADSRLLASACQALVCVFLFSCCTQPVQNTHYDATPHP